MVWGFVRLLRRERLGRVEVAVLAGVAALGLHNLFDFSLELPACAVAAWVALAAVARPEERGAEAPGTVWRLSPVRGAGPRCGARVRSRGWRWWPGGTRWLGAEEELAGLVQARAPLAEVRARALALIDRHPADYLLYSLAGSAYSAGGKATAEDALAFVNRALYLRPMDAASHRTAARALLALGRRSQALPGVPAGVRVRRLGGAGARGAGSVAHAGGIAGAHARGRPGGGHAGRGAACRARDARSRRWSGSPGRVSPSR